MLEVGIEDLELLTVKDVAPKLKCSVRQVWRLIHSGELESVRVGVQGVRVRPSDLAAYIKGLPPGRQSAPESAA